MEEFVLRIVGILAIVAIAIAAFYFLSGPKDNKIPKGSKLPVLFIGGICLALGILTGFLIGYDAAKKTNNDDKIETNSDTKMLIINDSIVVPIQPQADRIIILDTNEE